MEMKVYYGQIELSETHKISDIDASVYIKNAWRDIDGRKQLIFLDYQEKGFPSEIEIHKKALETTIHHRGFAIGAFNEDGLLIGFASMNREVFGQSAQYVLVDQLFVSKEYRHQGLGNKLMKLCVDEAKRWRVDKLYICAGSSEDTIAFYKSFGCTEAKEINQNLYARDPRDFQLEYVL